MNPLVILSKLTPKQRQAFVLRYVHNWPLRRIALRLGGSRGSICNLLRRADQRIGIGTTLPPRVRLRRRRKTRALSLSRVRDY